jgi:hypothetical protein
MLRAFLPVLLIGLAASPALAEDEAEWRFGGDAYVGGRTVVVSGEPVDDLFAAGQSVTAVVDIDGSAHMVGQNVTLEGRVGENFYGAGQDVDIDAPVAGDVTIAGQNLRVTEPVTGDLRAAGTSIELRAPVAGNAILGGDRVRIDAVISGDVALGGNKIDWGNDARVDGELHIYTDDPESVEVPERVAGSDQVTVHEAREFEDVRDVPGMERPGLIERLRNWIGGVVVVGLLSTLFAAIAPNFLANLRARAIARPVFTGVVGFVGLSALIGSVILLAMTGFGILLIPLSIVAAVLLGIVGYVIGAYVLGVWATGVAGRGMPESTGDRAIAAFAGAAIAALVGLIPWIGWLAVMAIFLVGAGALVARTIRLDREDLAA